MKKNILLSREQIQDFVQLIGQPEASVLLNSFYNQYRKKLSSSDVAFLYDSEYLEKVKNHQVVRSIQDKFNINIYNQYSFNYIAKRNNKKNTNILDIGCGNGDFLLACATEFGINGYGVDFDSKAIEIANHKGKDIPTCSFYCQDVSDIVFDMKMDYIILNDVTEHLSDKELSQLFTRISRILSTNGELLIHTPNGLALCHDTDSNLIQWIYKLYLKFIKNWKGFERTVEQIYYDQVHINIKSFQQLKKILTQHHFRTKVYYDIQHKYFVMNQLSSNMLVVAKLNHFL